MLQSLHHRLLLSGLLLLAGAVVAALQVSNGIESRVTNSPARPAAAGVVRSSRGETEGLPVLQAASADGISSPVSDAHAGEAVAGPRPEARAGLLVSDSAFSEEEQAGEESLAQQSGSGESGSFHTPAFTPDVSFSQEHAWVTNSPLAPGSSLSFDKQTATVTAAQPVAGSPGVAVAVVLEDLPPQRVAAPGASPGSEPEAAGETDPSTPGAVARRSGFTYQQELFRTKWGWSAYNEVQKILREDTSD